jgi:gliding motility-associated-like protein
MTSGGGVNNSGTIFRIKPDGTDYLKILDFNGANGRGPEESLMSDGTFLYGMTIQGGTNNLGTIFKIMPDGTGYVKLMDFAGTANGAYPYGSLISDGDFLYGMTSYGGANNFGTVFKIKPDGTGFVTLFESTNLDVREPRGSLISDGTFLYGMAIAGGTSNSGIIFKIKPDGTMYSRLWNFDGPNGVSSWGSLIFDGTFLCGMTIGGGINDSRGTIFKFSPAPAAFPTITDTTPASGPVGTTVVITGTNFSAIPADNTVYFNGTLAIVTASSATSITTTVPAGAATGPITVEVAGNTAITTWDFRVITITSHPSGVITCPGGTATFTTTATGSSNIRYEWYFAPVIEGPYIHIPAADQATNTLVVYNTENSDAGFYRCAVYEDWASAQFTNPAQLTVEVATAPTTTGAASCAASSLIVNAYGGTNGQYRWYTTAVGGTPIAGEVNSSYTTPVISESTTYYVTIDNGTCESVRTAVVAAITCTANLPPSIIPVSTTIQIDGKITLDLTVLISDPDNNLDLSTLKIITQPESKAIAFIDSETNLTIDYKGNSFTGRDHLTIEVCDLAGSCTQQEITIDVEGDIIVYNAISPNGDNKNDAWIIKNIELLQDTRFNHVAIFNRWGDAVFEVDNYDNLNKQFNGRTKNGGELPSGTYFYKIDFASGRKSLTGYISLKR